MEHHCNPDAGPSPDRKADSWTSSPERMHQVLECVAENTGDTQHDTAPLVEQQQGSPLVHVSSNDGVSGDKRLTSRSKTSTGGTSPSRTERMLVQLKSLHRKVKRAVSLTKEGGELERRFTNARPSSTANGASFQQSQCSPSQYKNASFENFGSVFSYIKRAKTRELERCSAVYSGTYREKQFVCEGVRQLLRILLTLLEERGEYSKIVVGFSGGETPRQIFSTVASLCDASVGPSCVRCLGSSCLEENTQSFEGVTATESDYSTVDWSRVMLFLVDERYVPSDDPRSNQRMIRDALLSHDAVNIPEENLVFPNTQLPLDTCVEDYHSRLFRLFSLYGNPHLVTLGFGNDGHTASWFPPLSEVDFSRAYAKEYLVCHTIQNRFDVRHRITVSMHVLCSAETKLFFLNGAEKVQTWRRLVEAANARDASIHIREEPVLQLLQTPGVSVLSCPPVFPDEYDEFNDEPSLAHLSIVIFGASGDLARRKTLPAIFSLFCEGHLPENFHVVCYARTEMSSSEFWNKIEPDLLNLDSFFKGVGGYQKAAVQDPSLGLLKNFKSRTVYICGDYQSDEGMGRLGSFLSALDINPQVDSRTSLMEGYDEAREQSESHRLFYLALPPDVFFETIRHTRRHCWSSTGWNRVVIEKPFGRDLTTAQDLACKMLNILNEKETYRIDHYLGKEMVQNLMVLRFGNAAFAPLMSWHRVSAVRITFKETIGTAGRGGYFDRYGIIRDILQNHLLQLLTIIAMERPASLKDNDIRDEKVKVLKQIPAVAMGDIVVGQYTASADGTVPGYLNDPTVPPDSLCPTFCTTVLHIHNERWDGVPFILKAGKALEERSAEIRIQLRPVPGNLFGSCVPQNELVIKVQPSEAVYMKVLTKRPGFDSSLEQIELDFSVARRLDVKRIPDAYERLLVDVLRGAQQNFVRTDELLEAWRIFTPVLQELESCAIRPIPYPAGSRGPQEAYELIKRYGYKRYEGYRWDPAVF